MTQALARPVALAAEKPRIAVSACLLGHSVRYDGGHKANAFIQRLLTRYVECVAVCPEVGIGLGIPRPPLRLINDGAEIRVVAIHDASLDVTARLQAYAAEQHQQLTGIAGYIFKSRSPSCGLQNVPLFNADGSESAAGRGVFAADFLRSNPSLPAEEETRLTETGSRDSFLKRVFAWHRWSQQIAGNADKAALESFHRQHRLLLMAHGMKGFYALSRLVDEVDKNIAVADEYLALFMAHLRQPVTRAGNGLVLKFLLRELQGRLMFAEGARIEAAVSAYNSGHIQLHEPLALMRAAVRRLDLHVLDGQVFFEPFPNLLAD